MQVASVKIAAFEKSKHRRFWTAEVASLCSRKPEHAACCTVRIVRWGVRKQSSIDTSERAMSAKSHACVFPSCYKLMCLSVTSHEGQNVLSIMYQVPGNTRSKVLVYIYIIFFVVAIF